MNAIGERMIKEDCYGTVLYWHKKIESTETDLFIDDRMYTLVFSHKQGRKLLKILKDIYEEV